MPLWPPQEHISVLFRHCLASNWPSNGCSNWKNWLEKPAWNIWGTQVPVTCSDGVMNLSCRALLKPGLTYRRHDHTLLLLHTGSTGEEGREGPHGHQSPTDVNKDRRRHGHSHQWLLLERKREIADNGMQLLWLAWSPASALLACCHFALQGTPSHRTGWMAMPHPPSHLIFFLASWVGSS